MGLAMRVLVSVLAMTFVFPFMQPVLAQPESDTLSIRSTVLREREFTADNGNRQRILEPFDTVTSGDRLIYSLAYRKNGRTNRSAVFITNPVPSTVRFEQSLRGDEQVSVDGGRHWGQLENLRVPTGNGGSRAARAEDITHLRWQVANAEDNGRLTYRAVVR